MQSMAERLYAAIGRADMIKDPRFATNSARLANTDEAERPIREFIARHDFAECLALFEQAEVTAAPIYDIDQFVDDPHVRERQIVVDVPDEEIGSVTMHNVIPRLSATPGVLRRPAPEARRAHGAKSWRASASMRPTSPSFAPRGSSDGCVRDPTCRPGAR